MAINLKAALAKYGFVASLANAVPELRNLLTQAMAGGWDVNRFSKALQDSHWWRNSADSIKNYQVLKATKPGEFRAQRDLLVNRARTIAAEMGVGLTEGSHGTLAHIVDAAQMHGWDEAMLRQQIGHQLVGATATFGGQAGEIQQRIRAMYANNGVPYSDYTVNLDVRSILEGRKSEQGIQAQVTKQALSAFPGLAEEIRAGHTVAEIAQPYINTQAQLLEADPSTISLTKDRLLRSGLQARGPKGEPVTMPLWQFEQRVKADPRWDKTKNAMNDYSQMAEQIGRDWGFIS
jgi:hypothetical protein